MTARSEAANLLITARLNYRRNRAADRAHGGTTLS